MNEINFRTFGRLDGKEKAQSFTSEAEAVEAARTMESAGATGITVERVTTNKAEDFERIEEIDWRA